MGRLPPLRQLWSGLLLLSIATTGTWGADTPSELLLTTSPDSGKLIRKTTNNGLSALLLPGEKTTGDAAIGNLINLGNSVVFAAYTPEHGRELWRTDGTERGTYLLKDTLPGPGGGINNPLTAAVTQNKQLFFWSSRDKQITLWKTDGTAQGTLPLHHFPRSQETLLNTTPPRLLTLKNRALFMVADGKRGEALWHSDGTRTGTKLLLDASKAIADEKGRLPVPGGLTPNLYQLTANYLYLLTKDVQHHDHQHPVSVTLWRTDGSQHGTVKLKQLSRHSNWPVQLLHADDQEIYYYYKAADSSLLDLWRLNLRDNKTRHLMAIGDSEFPYLEYLSDALKVNRKLYFKRTGSNSDNTITTEVWVTDGTDTRQLFKMLNPEDYLTSPLINLDDQIYFLAATAAENQSHSGRKNQHENHNPPALLWHIDGGADRPAVKPLALPGRSAEWYTPANTDFGIIVNDNLLVAIPDDERRNILLWQINRNTPAKTRLIGRFNSFAPIASPRQIINGVLVFMNGHEVWQTDGTPGGTRKQYRYTAAKKDNNTYYSQPGPQWPAVIPTRLNNNQLLFSLRDQAYGDELWVYDSAQPQLRLLKDINPTLTHPGINGLLRSGRYWYFQRRQRLWVTDGTTAGTSAVKQLPAQYKIWSKVASHTGQYLYLLTRPEHQQKPSPLTLWQISGDQATKLHTINSNNRPELFAGYAGAYLFHGHTAGRGQAQQHSFRLDKITNGEAKLVTLLAAEKQRTATRITIKAGTADGFLYTKNSNNPPAGKLTFFTEKTRHHTLAEQVAVFSSLYQTPRRIIQLTQATDSTPAVISQFDTNSKTFVPLTDMPPHLQQNPGHISAFTTDSGVFLLQEKTAAGSIFPASTLWYLADDQKTLQRLKDFPPDQQVRPMPTDTSLLYLNVGSHSDIAMNGENTTVWQSDGTPSGTRALVKRMQVESMYAY